MLSDRRVRALPLRRAVCVCKETHDTGDNSDFGARSGAARGLGPLRAALAGGLYGVCVNAFIMSLAPGKKGAQKSVVSALTGKRAVEPQRPAKAEREPSVLVQHWSEGRTHRFLFNYLVTQRRRF